MDTAETHRPQRKMGAHPRVVRDRSAGPDTRPRELSCSQFRKHQRNDVWAARVGGKHSARRKNRRRDNADRQQGDRKRAPACNPEFAPIPLLVRQDARACNRIRLERRKSAALLPRGRTEEEAFHLNPDVQITAASSCRSFYLVYFISKARW